MVRRRKARISNHEVVVVAQRGWFETPLRGSSP